jgi:hypothetical protein
MKIGMHKLGFSDPSSLEGKDTNGMFTEVKLLMSLFIEAGHEVEYVKTKNIYLKRKKRFDILFVFNGHENSTSNLQNLYNVTDELNYILTDTRFLEMINDAYIDNYFVQGPMEIFKKPTYNSMLHKLPIYENEVRLKEIASTKRGIGHNSINKVIFGGSVRERKSKIYEYIIRPDVNYFLKFEELGYDTRVPIDEYRQLLRKHQYGIVLLNPKDAVVGNITWRYYEYLINGCLTFVDRASDPNNLLTTEDSFMRVGSYEEMVKKIKLLEDDVDLKRSMYEAQASKITREDKWGATFLEALIEKRFKNDR